MFSAGQYRSTEKINEHFFKYQFLNLNLTKTISEFSIHLRPFLCNKKKLWFCSPLSLGGGGGCTQTLVVRPTKNKLFLCVQRLLQRGPS